MATRQDLEALNDALVGRIEVTGAYGAVGAELDVGAILLADSAIAFGGDRPEVPPTLDELGLIEVACLAASLISAISEDYWCAGWLKGIGAESHGWADTTAPVPCRPGELGRLSETDVSSLARLRARLRPWWVAWVDALEGVALVRASSLAVAKSGGG